MSIPAAILTGVVAEKIRICPQNMMLAYNTDICVRVLKDVHAGLDQWSKVLERRKGLVNGKATHRL